MDDREQEIRRRAHELWENAGQPAGGEMEFWLQAEREVNGEPLDPPKPLFPD
jgi:hypothetical protein